MAINVNAFNNKVAGVLPGTGIDVSAINNINDCFKNIDDIILNNVQNQLATYVMNLDSVQKINDTFQKVKQLQDTVNQVNDEIENNKKNSLVGMLNRAKKLGLIDRIKILAEIQSQFGSAVDNLNDIIDNISSFNPCQADNYITNVDGLPVKLAKPTRINEPEINIPLPDPGPSTAINNSFFTEKEDYYQSLHRIGEIINDKDGVTQTSSGVSMMSSLQTITRDLHDFTVGTRTPVDLPFDEKISTLSPPEIYAKAAENELAKNADVWAPEDKKEFKIRTQSVLGLFEKDTPVLQKWWSSRRENEGEESFINFENFINLNNNRKKSFPVLNGSLVSNGITLYGGPDWNYLRFLAIAPNDRPQNLIDYWANERNKDIDNDIKIFSEKFKLKLGTRDYESIFLGEYNKKLKSGYSVSSTKFKGGTVLKLKNQDGSIYDPAGINPEGLVTVVDASDGIKDFSLLNLYVDKEHVDAYSKSQIQNVKVFLVSNGTETCSLYEKAQEKYA